MLTASPFVTHVLLSLVGAILAAAIAWWVWKNMTSRDL